jgi:hypothetical protein
MSLLRFNEIWTSGHYPPLAVSERDLSVTEHRLELRFPEDYREAVLTVGLPRPTNALLAAIVEGELDLNPLGDFYSPAEIIEETLGWREIGMPSELVAFASDGGGNKFCFDRTKFAASSTDARAIWFFDHDFATVDQIAPSFDAWITAYCEVKPVPNVGSV